MGRKKDKGKKGKERSILISWLGGLFVSWLDGEEYV